jgi:PAS domain S-box-containing protein
VTPTESIPDDAGTQGLLASIVVNAPVPIFFKDLAGVYLFVNDAYVEQGDDSSREQVVGRTDAELYPEPIATAFREDDLAAIEAGGPVQSARPFMVGGEERIFKTVKFPIQGTSGKTQGICGISIDITDTLRDQDEREVQRQRDIDAKPFGRLLATLTNQETRIANLLSLGYSDKEIADQMNLTPDTVRHHVSHVLKKLHKRSRTQAVIEILRYRGGQ